MEAIEKTKSKVRESNIELYRIVLMLLIVAHHYVVNSGLLDIMYNEPYNSKSIFLFIYGAWGKIGINCFILITGFFMCKQEITLKKFLKLLFEVEFYKITIYLIFLMFGIEKASIREIIKIILPVSKIATNFTGCFIIFYLFIPFINILINNMNKTKHRLLILLLLFVYSFLGNIPGITITLNYISLYFVIYLIGAYIKLYPEKIFYRKKIINLILISLIIIDILSILVCIYFGYKINVQMAYYFINDSNKILAILTSITLFLCFKNMNIGYSKFINTVARSTFGVLLIHSNTETMRNFLWRKLLNNVSIYETNSIYIHAILSIIGVFVICIIIDYIRIKLIEEKFFEIIYDKIIYCYNKINKKFKQKEGS